MKPFSTIAILHKDILEGKLTLDRFAADLWLVHSGKAEEEYSDPDIFFKKTYITDGLKNLLNIVEKRIKGKGGDSVIQLQTPFGGGKTHSLIALYHSAKEWKTNIVVIDGTSLDPKKITLWEEIELQLTKKIEKLKGRTSPGKEILREVLLENQPLIILLDEVLEYTTKSSGVVIGDSTISAQTLAFIQELTQTVNTLDKTALVITLPSSALEHYDEGAEKLFQQLQKITGRVEKIYTPVQDEEITDVITKRLFNNIDIKEAKKVIEEFLDYAEREKLLPLGLDKTIYREKFIKSYPFQPEVIDVLYKRWGSFPTFQRTRGVLRLLSLLVYSLKDTKKSFVRLSDFNFKNDEIKMEFIKHIGQEYNSVLASDIISKDSGAKKIDNNLGNAYIPFSFGTSVTTTIFLYSFSGGVEKGATVTDIKLSNADISVSSSIVVEAVEKLKESLFYLQYEQGKYFFTNQSNLNKILLTKMEGVDNRNIEEEEKNLIKNNLKKEYFKICIWVENTRDIPDNKELKLIILKNYNKSKCNEFKENCGDRPRVYRNVIIFLTPIDSERINFENFIKRKLSLELIEQDKTLQLNTEQRKEIKKSLEKIRDEELDYIRRLYRIVLVPSRDGFKEIDLGIPTFGTTTFLDTTVYEALKNEQEILEKLHPQTLKEKYLKDKDLTETKNILDNFFKTPGELRITSEDALRNCIEEGIKKGIFKLGEIIRDKDIEIKKDATPIFTDSEVLVIRDKETPEIKSPAIKEIPKGKIYRNIHLKLNVPLGKISDVAGMINFIRTKFENVSVKTEITAKEGEISKLDYEDKILETINQAGIKVEEEEIE